MKLLILFSLITQAFFLESLFHPSFCNKLKHLILHLCFQLNIYEWDFLYQFLNLIKIHKAHYIKVDIQFTILLHLINQFQWSHLLQYILLFDQYFMVNDKQIYNQDCLVFLIINLIDLLLSLNPHLRY